MQFQGKLRVTFHDTEEEGKSLSISAESADGSASMDLGSWPVSDGQSVCVEPICLECEISTQAGPCGEESRKPAPAPAPTKSERTPPNPHSTPPRPRR